MPKRFVPKLAAQLGLRLSKTEDSALVAAYGVLEGYVVVAGPSLLDASPTVQILIRFPAYPQSESVRQRIETDPQILAARGLSELTGRHRKELHVNQEFVLWTWGYVLWPPTAERVAALARALTAVLRQQVPAFEGKCEVCRKSGVSEVTLRETLPVLACEACQEDVDSRTELLAAAYDAMPTNLPAGIVFGLAAAVAGSLAWAALEYWLERVFPGWATTIGAFIGWAVVRGMGKRDRFARVLTAVLTVLSVLGGDLLYLVVTAAEELARLINPDLIKLVFLNFLRIEMQGRGILTLLFALGGGVWVLHRMDGPEWRVRARPREAAPNSPDGA